MVFISHCYVYIYEVGLPILDISDNLAGYFRVTHYEPFVAVYTHVVDPFLVSLDDIIVGSE